MLIYVHLQHFNLNIPFLCIERYRDSLQALPGEFSVSDVPLGYGSGEEGLPVSVGLARDVVELEGMSASGTLVGLHQDVTGVDGVQSMHCFEEE